MLAEYPPGSTPVEGGAQEKRKKVDHWIASKARKAEEDAVAAPHYA